MAIARTLHVKLQIGHHHTLRAPLAATQDAYKPSTRPPVEFRIGLEALETSYEHQKEGCGHASDVWAQIQGGFVAGKSHLTVRIRSSRLGSAPGAHNPTHLPHHLLPRDRQRTPIIHNHNHIPGVQLALKSWIQDANPRKGLRMESEFPQAISPIDSWWQNEASSSWAPYLASPHRC